MHKYLACVNFLGWCHGYEGMLSCGCMFRTLHIPVPIKFVYVCSSLCWMLSCCSTLCLVGSCLLLLDALIFV
jgi:hypothetical protein